MQLDKTNVLFVKLIKIVLLCLLVLFVIYPLFKVFSLTNFEVFKGIFSNQRWLLALKHSLMMMGLSTLTAVGLGFLFAYTMDRVAFFGKNVFRFVTLLPIISPPFVMGMSYILLLGRQGLISNILGINLDIYGWKGLWFVQTLTFFPISFSILYSTLQQLNSGTELAAYNMGAHSGVVFKDVTWPMIRPAILASILVTSMNVMADFGNPAVVGGDFVVLSTEAYQQMVGNFNLPASSALAILLLIPAMFMFVVNQFILKKRSVASMQGKESHQGHYPLPKFTQRFLLLACILFSVIILLVYCVLFAGAFTKLWGYDWRFDLGNMQQVLGRHTKEITNTLIVSFSSALISGILACVLALILKQTKTKVNQFLEFLTLIVGAIPGTFLGLGYAMAYNNQLFNFTGSYMIMISALAFWNLTVYYTTLKAALEQIGDNIIFASRNLGANIWQTLHKVLLPLMTKALASGFTVAFLRSSNCLSVIVFIYSVNTSVLTNKILAQVSTGKWGSASALTVILCIIDFFVLGLSRYLIHIINRQKEE